jgi:RNA recognition motif-containing protein
VSSLSKGKILFLVTNYTLYRPLFKQFYFAFVQFNKIEDAKKVLEEIRYPEIKGVRCRALPYNRPSGGVIASTDSQKKSSSF